MLITIVYWTLLYNGGEGMSSTDRAIDFLQHLVPAVVLLLEFSINAVVFKYSHMLHLAFLLLIYGIVNLTVTKSRGRPVYDIITWEDGGTAGVLVGMLVGTIAFYVGFTYITRLREKRYNKPRTRIAPVEEDRGTFINSEVM